MYTKQTIEMMQELTDCQLNNQDVTIELTTGKAVTGKIIWSEETPVGELFFNEETQKPFDPDIFTTSLVLKTTEEELRIGFREIIDIEVH